MSACRLNLLALSFGPGYLWTLVVDLVHPRQAVESGPSLLSAVEAGVELIFRCFVFGGLDIDPVGRPWNPDVVELSRRVYLWGSVSVDIDCHAIDSAVQFFSMPLFCTTAVVWTARRASTVCHREALCEVRARVGARIDIEEHFNLRFCQYYYIMIITVTA